MRKNENEKENGKNKKEKKEMKNGKKKTGKEKY